MTYQSLENAWIKSIIPVRFLSSYLLNNGYYKINLSRVKKYDFWPTERLTDYQSRVAEEITST